MSGAGEGTYRAAAAAELRGYLDRAGLPSLRREEAEACVLVIPDLRAATAGQVPLIVVRIVDVVEGAMVEIADHRPGVDVAWMVGNACAFGASDHIVKLVGR